MGTSEQHDNSVELARPLSSLATVARKLFSDELDARDHERMQKAWAWLSTAATNAGVGCRVWGTHTKEAATHMLWSCSGSRTTKVGGHARSRLAGVAS